MSDAAPKTWAALSRRDEGEPPFDFLMDLCLQALMTDSNMGLVGHGVMLPHTIVYRQADQVKWYYTSPTKGVVQKKPSQITTTAIRRALSVQGTPEGPVAVWHSERKDAKGYLYTQEFFDEARLKAFLKHRADRGRCGVLQKFILPKDIKGKEGVNHELLVVSDSYLTVERRFNNTVLEPSKAVGITQQSCVHTAIPTIGKLTPPPSAIVSPYHPSEISVGYDEMQSTTLLSVLGPAMKFLNEQLSSLRREACNSVVRQDREISCLFKVDRSNQLWLLGFGHTKSSEKGVDWSIPDFEFIKKKRRKTGIEEERTPLDLNFALSPNSHTQQATGKEIAAKKIKKIKTRKQPADQFLCPNCSSLVAKGSVHVTTYLSIMRYFDRRTKEQKQCVMSSNKIDNTNQSSPFTNPDSTAFLDQSHNWVTVPPVLQRLSKSIEEIRRNDVWLNRQVTLCQACYSTFYDSTDENMQLQQCYEKELALKKSKDISKFSAWCAWVNERTIDAKFSLVDDMVFTDLQSHHRGLQSKTRQKLHCRHQLYNRVSTEDGDQSLTKPAPPTINKPPGYKRVAFGPATAPITSAEIPVVSPQTKKQSEEDDGSWATHLKQLEMPGPAGTEMESTISTVLCNQLFSELTSQLTFGAPHEGEGDDVAIDHRLHGVYGMNKNRIPFPDRRIEISIPPSDQRMIKEREASSSHVKHKNAMYSSISDILPIFGTLSTREKDLFLGVVSTSYSKEQDKAKQELLRKKGTDDAT